MHGDDESKIYEYELEKEQEDKNIEKSKSDIGWGHQIRSYVLHPYRLVKDNRTGQKFGSRQNIRWEFR